MIGVTGALAEPPHGSRRRSLDLQSNLRVTDFEERRGVRILPSASPQVSTTAPARPSDL